MSGNKRTVIFAVVMLFCLRVAAADEQTLQVLLQGASAGELASLVEDVGGVLTHDLHIINAIGAKLTPEQLEIVLESPIISRHIDDLSSTERPEDDEEIEEACKVRGHIELEFTSQGIRWPLYNKRATPALLESLEITWPPQLGSVKTMHLGDVPVPALLYDDTEVGALTIDFPESQRPEVAKTTDFKISFQSPVSGEPSSPLSQSEFTLKASFVGGCSTDLVPGYESNHEDFYYNRVAGIEALHRQGITGKGVTVAVIDSGLWEHDALVRDTGGKSRLLARYDALSNREDAEVVDESGHGTHISSIIVNSDPTTVNGRPTGTYKGVAPDANLVVVKVLDRDGLAHVLEIVRAIQWVVDHREEYGVRVLNLSFAQTPRWPFWEDPVNQAVMVAWDQGIAVVAAAGNEGPDEGTIGSPGNLPGIITVGAVTDSWTPNTRDDDYIPDFSSRGPTPTGYVKPDIVALGGHMTGLIHPESAIAQDQPEDILATGEFVSTGTSQASALVAGILALLVQLEPDISPNQLKCKLITSAEPAINRDGKLAYSPFQQGFGYVTATRAVTLGQKVCELTEPNLQSAIRDEDYDFGPAIVAEDGTASLPGLEQIVSSIPSEKGLSKTRKWGVKDHIERLNTEPSLAAPGDEDPFNWREIYLMEKARIDGLAKGASTD